MKTNLCLLILMLIIYSTLLHSQQIIWEETFDTNPGTWTLDQNWEIIDGTLTLSWSPIITHYDLSAISPVISLPSGSVYECIATQYFQVYSAVDEIAEISILYDGQEEVLWDWELIQGNWGVLGGQDLALSITAYAGEDVQFKFHSDGASTYNFDYWIIYNLAITESLDHDLCGFSIDGPSSCIINQEETWTVTVKNTGLNVEDDYTVKLMKEGEVELGSVAVTTHLAPGEYASFNFNWTPAIAEYTYLYGKIELQGDEFPGNDITTELTVNVYPEDVVHALIWDNDNYSELENPDLSGPLGCEKFLETALDINNIMHETVIGLPSDLSSYDVVLVTLGVFCVD